MRLDWKNKMRIKKKDIEYVMLRTERIEGDIRKAAELLKYIASYSFQGLSTTFAYAHSAQDNN